MPTQDTSQIKDKIISFLKINGPSLPVHIAGQIDNSILFTSAFLSELLSEKRVKISNMRVGSSPLYFLTGQEPQLERFSQYLKSKEKEAFLLLKDKRFLKDSVQQPAIRVALREIKDFAIPFRNGDLNEIFWRYFIIPENEFTQKKDQNKEVPIPEVIKEGLPLEKREKDLGIFDKQEKEKEDKPIKKKRKSVGRQHKKKQASNEKLFNEVKEFMNKKSISLKDISSFSKSEIVLIVEENGKEKILLAFNKNKIGEKEISKSSKKSKELGLPYIILGKYGVLKKIESLISDLENMDSIGSLSD